jgi:hypothetical protein
MNPNPTSEPTILDARQAHLRIANVLINLVVKTGQVQPSFQGVVFFDPTHFKSAAEEIGWTHPVILWLVQQSLQILCSQNPDLPKWARSWKLRDENSSIVGGNGNGDHNPAEGSGPGTQYFANLQQTDKFMAYHWRMLITSESLADHLETIFEDHYTTESVPISEEVIQALRITDQDCFDLARYLTFALKQRNCAYTYYLEFDPIAKRYSAKKWLDPSYNGGMCCGDCKQCLAGNNTMGCLPPPPPPLCSLKFC